MRVALDYPGDWTDITGHADADIRHLRSTAIIAAGEVDTATLDALEIDSRFHIFSAISDAGEARYAADENLPEAERWRLHMALLEKGALDAPALLDTNISRAENAARLQAHFLSPDNVIAVTHYADTSDLNTAIGALQSGERLVVVSSGTYSSTLDDWPTNVIVETAPGVEVVIQPISGDRNVRGIHMDNTERVILRGQFIIDGSQMAGDGFRVSGDSEHICVLGISIREIHGRGIDREDVHGAAIGLTARWVVMSDCKIYRIGHPTIYSDHHHGLYPASFVQYAILRRNQVWSCSGHGIHGQGTELNHLWIEANQVKWCRRGIGVYSGNVTILNNQSLDNTEMGIAARYNVLHLWAEGNLIDGTFDGFYIGKSDEAAPMIFLTRNTIRNTAHAGVWCQDPVVGIISVTRNTFQNSGTWPVRVADGDVARVIQIDNTVIQSRRKVS